MFAGHIGVALAGARAEPRVNVGVLTAASLLLDILLWVFVLLGRESVEIPADFSQTHQPLFVFPYSHGLIASVVWSTLAGALVFWLCKNRRSVELRTAFLVAGVVFSHWLLDALVHRPELPLMGTASAKVGVGLWNHLPIALTIEAALVFAGLFLYLPRRGLSRRRTLAFAGVVVLTLVFTLVGMTMAPPPPSAAAMAGSSLGIIVLVCVLIGWLGNGARKRNP